MSMTDPMADLLTRIRNAGMAGHAKLDLPSSNMKVAVATVLQEQGYLKNFKVISDNKQGILRIFLKYDENQLPVIHEIKRISKPGCRVYVGKGEIPRVKNGLGISILSTSKGVMDDVSARRENVGGEVICTVW
ncbi:MAG: 30S ribosomal protein S8 [Desulfuromonadales bacterium]|nr:30S ribosomal protein S8 [Desulfuromonadales bacterium]